MVFPTPNNYRVRNSFFDTANNKGGHVLWWTSTNMASNGKRNDHTSRRWHTSVLEIRKISIWIWIEGQRESQAEILYRVGITAEMHSTPRSKHRRPRWQSFFVQRSYFARSAARHPVSFRKLGQETVYDKGSIQWYLNKEKKKVVTTKADPVWMQSCHDRTRVTRLDLCIWYEFMHAHFLPS